MACVDDSLPVNQRALSMYCGKLWAVCKTGCPIRDVMLEFNKKKGRFDILQLL
jgi:hypothetical protein